MRSRTALTVCLFLFSCPPWLDKLNQHNGNFVSAEMVKLFILSIEYKNRFGQ